MELGVYSPEPRVNGLQQMPVALNDFAHLEDL
jgi:hypothetical protein